MIVRAPKWVLGGVGWGVGRVATPPEFCRVWLACMVAPVIPIK